MPIRLSGTYYTTKDAAEVLDRTESRIRQMARDGKIEVVNVSAHACLIPEREIKRLLKEREAVAT